MVKRHTVIEK